MTGLECGDERQEYLFDDRGGTSGCKPGFGGGEVGRQRLVVEHIGYPTGEVVAWTVVAQHAPASANELGFKLRKVGGNCPVAVSGWRSDSVTAISVSHCRTIHESVYERAISLLRTRSTGPLSGERSTTPGRTHRPGCMWRFRRGSCS